MSVKGYIKAHVPDSIFLRYLYYKKFGRMLNLRNPKTFNEKLQWLKLYDRRPEYTTMVDKYEVKRYVADRIGEQYIIPTLGVWNSFDEIDFDALPDQFVLKCTHDSGGLVICTDKSKLNVEYVRTKLNACLKRNYYYEGREWPYKNVKPRIIAEQYMVDESGVELKDFKLMCFNGNVKCTFVCSERFNNLKITFFDNNWSKLPFERPQHPASDKSIPKPRNFEKMINLAMILSKNIPFVRVDFYDINGRIYFGELTFYPADGFEEFNPEEWDYKLGKLIKLPRKRV